MALNDLLQLSTSKKVGLSEERVTPLLPKIREYTAFWREYPDLFVDFLAGPNSTFKFYFYQRVFLRAAMRHKYFYGTFPRAYSKSFLSMMILMVRCILYPGAKLFVTSGGKEQAAGIVREKVDEICNLIPAFQREINRTPGRTKMEKDYVRVEFKSGSYFDVIAARESSRGKRRHGGLIEECVGVDGTLLNEVIVPIMNISRRCKNGEVRQEETLNKSQIYITTAGWRNTYAYDKLIQLLIWQVVRPGSSMILGGTWRIPVLMELLDKNFIQDLRMDGTFNESSFDREYESIWSGSAEGAFFHSEAFDRNRILNQPEYEYSGRSNKNAYYIISVDVGRKGCDTVACVIKVTPQPSGNSQKTLVNLFSWGDMHFEDQAIKLKQLYYKYKARTMVIDGNGMGIGLIDYMVKSQIDPDTNEVYPDFGIVNDDANYYKKYRTVNTEYDAVYIIKANPALNTEAHVNAQSQLSSGKVKFLIDERVAKAKLLGTARGSKMTADERADYLRPFTLTSILREEILNLREENEGINILLKRANKGIQKDKFSALEYGLYYVKQIEEQKKKKKKFSARDFMFMN